MNTRKVLSSRGTTKSSTVEESGRRRTPREVYLGKTPIVERDLPTPNFTGEIPSVKYPMTGTAGVTGYTP